jgi:hypothetical protein
MDRPFLAEVRRDERSGRLAVVEYRYEAPATGRGPGTIRELRFRRRFPWRRALLLGAYLLAVAGAELVMAEDNSKVGAGLLVFVVGAFLALGSLQTFSAGVGDRAAKPYLITEPVHIDTEEVQRRVEPRDVEMDRDLLASWLERASSAAQAHHAAATRLARRGSALTIAVVALSALAAVSSVAVLTNDSDRVVTAGLSAVWSIATALVAATRFFARSEEQSNQNRLAAVAWEALEDRIQQVLRRAPDERVPPEEMADLANRIDELVVNSSYPSRVAGLHLGD